MERKRIGVIVDSLLAPHWVYYVIDNLIMGDFAEVVLVIETGHHPLPQSNNAKGESCSKLLKEALSKYFRLDALFNPVCPNAFDRKSLLNVIEEIPQLQMDPREITLDVDKYTVLCEQIADYRLDVILAFGWWRPANMSQFLARDGIWYYQHGSPGCFSKASACFDEIANGFVESSAQLKIIRQDIANEYILCDCYGQTDTLSVFRNNNINHWKTAAYLIRQVKKLYQQGSERFFMDLEQIPQNMARGPEANVNRNQNKLYLLWQMVLTAVNKKNRHALYFEQYFLQLKLGSLAPLSIDPAEFSHLVPPVDRFWADPFVVMEQGKFYVFIEEVLGKGNNGHISCMEIAGDGSLVSVKPVINEPYHMSYPFVFQHGQRYYMIPETAANGTISLYRCDGFPYQWTKVQVLMKNIHAYDTTLLYHDGLWWIFATVCEHIGTPSNDELHIFFGKELLSDQWTPHPLNPVVCDVRSARPAGKIFEQDGSFYRPSQNCKPRYGYGLKINRIEQLSTSQYREQCIAKIEPGWDDEIVAVHTINQTEGMIVMDGVLKRMRPLQDYFRYFRKLIRQ